MNNSELLALSIKEVLAQCKHQEISYLIYENDVNSDYTDNNAENVDSEDTNSNEGVLLLLESIFPEQPVKIIESANNKTKIAFFKMLHSLNLLYFRDIIPSFKTLI